MVVFGLDGVANIEGVGVIFSVIGGFCKLLGLREFDSSDPIGDDEEIGELKNADLGGLLKAVNAKLVSLLLFVISPVGDDGRNGRSILVDLGTEERPITAGVSSILMGIEMLSVSESCFLGANGEIVEILS